MSKTRLTRRSFGMLAAAAVAGSGSTLSLAQAPLRRPFVVDMHSHYGMFLPRIFGLDLDRHMRENGVALLAWAVVDDRPWMASTAGGNRQVAEPQPGQIWANFEKLMADYRERLRKWNVKLALAPADIDAALAGEPRVLLACESANFLEGQPQRLAQAHAMGVRHLQLVHYIHSPLADHQTAEPRNGGLSAVGAQVVAECKRLGIVLDLAHATGSAVDAALDASDGAVVWSHSWISPSGGNYKDPGYVARSLSLASAKKIAARGGAVGLWCLQLGRDPAYPVNNKSTYADEILRMCDLIGPEHVAFGTDMEGVWPGRMMNDYGDLRDVVDNLVRRGLPEATLNAVFTGNYMRIVRQAMNGAKQT